MKKIMKQMLPVMAIIGVTFIMSLFLYHEVMKLEKENCWQLLEDSAKSVTKEMQSDFQNDVSTLHLAADLLMQKQDSNETNLDNIMERFCEDTLFSRIEVIYPDSGIISSKEFTEIAEKGEVMSPRMEDPETGKKIVTYYVPIEEDGAVMAILAGVIETDTLTAKFQPSIYNGNAVCCVIDSRDGDFVMDQWHEDLENAYSMPARKKLKGYENVDLKEETKEQKTGVIAFTSQTTGKNLYMYYMPLQFFDWELEVFVPEDVAFERLIYLRSVLFLAGAVEMLLLSVYFFWNLRGVNKLTESKKETEEQLHISNTLIQCVTALSSEKDINIAIQDLLQIITEYFQADRTYIFFYDETRKIFKNTYEYAKEGVVPQKDTMPEIPASVLSKGIREFEISQVYYIPDIEKEKGCESYEILKGRGIQRLLAVPLRNDGYMTGFVSVDNPRASYDDATLLSSIQFFILNSLSRKEQKEQLQFMSYWDSLTTLYNRNKYMQMVTANKQKTLQNIGVAYMDLNGLKEINDKYGHEAGDTLIRTAAQIIRKIYPDCAYRIGGDEFVVLVTDIESTVFEEKIISLQEEMKQQNVSISIGKRWEESCDDLEGLLKEADQLMYLAKQKHYHTKRQMQG